MKPLRYLAPLLLLMLAACSFSLAADVTPPPNYTPPPVENTQAAPVDGPLYPLVAPDPAQGKALFEEKCAPCHGDTGQGDGPRASQLPNPVPALGSPELAREATPAGWYSIVTQGNIERFMPPFNSLTNRQRWDVVAYAFSLSEPEASLAQGKELYDANCASCHGEAGKGDGPAAAGLSRPPADLSSQAFMADRSAAVLFKAISEGVPPEMPAYAGLLSEDERWSLSGYLRSLTFAAPGQVAQSATTPFAAETQAAPEAGTQPAVTAEATVAVEGTPAVAESVGAVQGTVINPAGSKVPEGLQVTLHGFDQMQVAETLTTTLQADGSYIFPEVAMPPGRVFLTTVEYSGATYGSDIATVETGASTFELPITVHDTTSDTTALAVDRLHLFFEFTDADTLRVIELYVISNTGEKTIVPPGEGKPTITFSLPPGATNLEFQDGALGDRYIETDGGFGDTVSIQPGSGSYQSLFAFEMPYKRKLDLVQKVELPTNAVVVMVPEGSVKVQGENLTDGGIRPVQNANYQMYNGPSLAAGKELRLTITGKPASSSTVLSTGSSTNLLVGVAAFGVALVVAGIWLFQRSRSAEDEEDLEAEETLPTGAALESRETVMDAILALDDLYQAGQLPEEAYLKRRAELKARLKELME